MKQKPLREKIMLFSRKAGGWCFLIAMVGGLASLVFPPLAVLCPLFFMLALIFFGLMFLPGAFSPFYWPQFALFLCLTGAGVSVALMFAGIATQTPMKSDFMQGAGYLGMFAVLCGFAGMIGSGGNGPAAKKDLVDAMESAAKKLGLSFTDEKLKRALHLHAEGDSLKLDLRRNSNRGSPASAITFTPHVPPAPVKITCVKGVLEIIGPDSLRSEKLEAFIKKKDLNEYDFNLSAIGKDINLQVAVAIEEDDLWVDYVELCKLAGN